MRRLALLVLLGVLLLVARAHPCELCSPPAAKFGTLQAELRSAETVVLADFAGEGLSGSAVFVVRDVLRGGRELTPGQSVSVDRDVSGDGVYLLYGTGIALGAERPRRVEEDVAAFATLLARLPDADPERTDVWGERLGLVVPYLSDRDPLIAASAGQEFAIAPYAAVKAAKPHVRLTSLVAALRDRGTPVRNRGALALLIGVCGKPANAADLAALLTNESYRAATGYDAIVAAYLMLRGKDGLAAVRELVRSRLDEGDARTGVAVLAALRFHATIADEPAVLGRDAVLTEIRPLLDEDALAPAVILELATLEDWESLPRVMAAFRRLEPKSPLVLGPAARFVQECPLPAAAAARAEVTGGDGTPPADD